MQQIAKISSSLFNIWCFSLSFIQPCRSLCVAVRDSCAPVLACQGHPWPEALDCDRFPAEDDMCISPYAKFSHFAKGKGQLFTAIPLAQ